MFAELINTLLHKTNMTPL